jgi:hypothetical protein
MKKTNLIYWIFTGLMALMMGFGAVLNAMSTPESVTLISNTLGFPAFLVPFLGVAKLLAIAVILIPGMPALKEWAYAGLVYDLVGAIYSFISIGKPASEWSPILVFLLLIAVSYIFHHKRLKAATA